MMSSPSAPAPLGRDLSVYRELELKQAKALLDAGAIRAVSVLATGAQFVLTFQVGMEQKLLRAQRGRERRFHSADAAVRFLWQLGVAHSDLDLTHFDPRQRGLV